MKYKDFDKNFQQYDIERIKPTTLPVNMYTNKGTNPSKKMIHHRIQLSQSHVQKKGLDSFKEISNSVPGTLTELQSILKRIED